jgi:hypothetical protein
MSLVALSLASACAVRVAASGDVDLSATSAAPIGQRAALDVDLETDWIALTCPDLPRRIVLKPVRGRVVLEGLPAGPCVAWVGGRFPCYGELEPGRTTYLRDDDFPHYVTPSSPPDMLMRSSPMMGRAETETACEFLSREELDRPFEFGHGYALRPPTQLDVRVRELYWEHTLDRVE